jgi:hypothetical protein
MLNLNKIPSEFQVFSTQPYLRIRYSIPLWAKILHGLFLLPFLILFALNCWILFGVLHEILNLRFWQAIQILSYDTNNPWFVLGFVFTFFLLGVASGVWLWCLLGVIELHATRESLTIIYRLLGISRRISVLAGNIRYFNQFLDRSEGDSWELEIVTNQRLSDKNLSFPAWFPAKWMSEDILTRMNYKTIHLCAYSKPNPSEWLGKVLADFYKVEFQSTDRANIRLHPME